MTEYVMEANRIIGVHEGKEKGPLLICIGGIHGNEPAGVLALERVFQLLEQEPQKNPDFNFKGKLIGFRGNLKALKAKKRFIAKDMNRQWIPKNIKRILASPIKQLDAEDQELKMLHTAINKEIADYKPDKLIVMDLHTTTASGGIFSIATDDRDSQLIAMQLHAPVIRGMLDGIDGTTLHYYKPENTGVPTVAVCFESGQHDEPESIDNMVAAIINCMRTIGCVRSDDVENHHDERLLKYSANLPKIADLLYCHDIHQGDDFRMKPGYENFQWISKNELLAHDKSGEIRSDTEGLILMPLYQKQGEDGFFIVKEVKDF